MTANTIHAGLPGYTGPKYGWFTLLHHAGPLLEYSDDVGERLDYIDRDKLPDERAIRRAHILYFDPARLPDAEWRRADAEWRRADAELRRAEVGRQIAEVELRRADAELRRADAEWRRAEAKWRRADAEWRRALQPYAAIIEAFIRANVPDYRWNGSEIIFIRAQT